MSLGPSVLALPSRPALAALARKYEALARLRAARDRGAEAPRDALRAVATDFPGALRELDTLDEAALAARSALCRAAAAGAPRAPWMTWIDAYHRGLKAALTLRARIPGPAAQRPVLPRAALVAEAEALSSSVGLSIDADLIAAALHPPAGRLAPALLTWLAQRAGRSAAELSEILFPARRPPPYTFEAMAPLLDRLLQHEDSSPDAAAIVELPPALDAPVPSTTTYRELLARARAVAASLRAALPDWSETAGVRVALLAPPSSAYAEALLGALFAGFIAVPLSPLHTAPELAYVLENAAPVAVLVTEDLATRLPSLPSGVVPLRIEDARTGEVPADRSLPPASAAALMLYTSGTTGRPKGVVQSHAAIAATLSSLEEAWGWRREDRLLHVLPLHHTHGLVVALLGALWAGAQVRFSPFDAQTTWERLGEATVFMAVPTMYAKLCEAFDAAPEEARARFAAHARQLRLATSGSAALPPSLFARFAAMAGGAPLERYGMTEIGMALSNPLAGLRVAGAVGRELPGVTIDLVADDGRLCGPDEPGELRVRSPQLFSAYFGDPAATAAAFDDQGRFRTGDTGVRDGSGVVRLLGRTSTDVLKSGGYKISALEIEEALCGHPAIAEVAVIGLPDVTWGDLVTACAVLRPGAALSIEELRAWARDRLAPYKIPRALHLMQALPRNAMGKVQKGALKAAALG